MNDQPTVKKHIHIELCITTGEQFRHLKLLVDELLYNNYVTGVSLHYKLDESPKIELFFIFNGSLPITLTGDTIEEIEQAYYKAVDRSQPLIELRT